MAAIQQPKAAECMVATKHARSFNTSARLPTAQDHDERLLGLHWNRPLVSLLKISKLFWLFRELLDRTVNKDVYCAQLDRVAEILEDSGREEPVVFLHDNATPHTAKKTKKKLRDLNWDVLPHAPYSPDTAPSDFHLFRSLKHWLRGKRFTSIVEVEVGIQEFFDSKDFDFYERGINGLVDRWEQVIAFDGDYCN